MLGLISPGGEIKLLTHLIGEGHLCVSGWAIVSQRNSAAGELQVQRAVRHTGSPGLSPGALDAAAVPGPSGGGDL